MQSNTGRPHILGNLLLDFLQNRLSPLSDDDTIVVASPVSKSLLATKVSKARAKAAAPSPKPETKTTCLLCGEACVNRSSLTRHHGRKHLQKSFEQPFPCPECQRLGLGHHIIDSPFAWSSHAETYHGRDNAPNLLRERRIWHTGPTCGSRARCLLCNKNFQPGNGFARHLRKHKNEGTFTRPFECAGCPKAIWIDGLPAWIDHSARHHGGCPESGAVVLALDDKASQFTPSGAGLKRAHDDDWDATAAGPSAKICKTAHSPDHGWLSPSPADSIPIDPVLFES